MSFKKMSTHRTKGSLLWCDPTVGIRWPLDSEPKLVAKDAAGKKFAEADIFD